MNKKPGLCGEQRESRRVEERHKTQRGVENVLKVAANEPSMMTDVTGFVLTEGGKSQREKLGPTPTYI